MSESLYMEPMELLTEMDNTIAFLAQTGDIIQPDKA